MAVIDVMAFTGMRSAVAPHLLENNEAQKACGMDLENGEIIPCAAPMIIGSYPFIINSMYKQDLRHVGRGFVWRVYWDFRNFVESPIAQDDFCRLYMSKEGDGLWFIDKDDNMVRLGVLPPEEAAVVVSVDMMPGQEATPESRQTRAYTFTYVDVFGQESQPAPAVLVECFSSSTVILRLGNRPERYAPVAKKRVYRSVTGATGGTQYFYVGEISAEEELFTDTVLDTQVQEPLPSLDWLPPPQNLEHLLLLSGGVLAAHNEYEVRFSVPYLPYAWPYAYAYTLHGRIVNIALSQRTVFAFTEAFIYALTVEDPAHVYVTMLDGFAPCLSVKGVVASKLGVLFPSSDGLYIVSQGQSMPENITNGIISELEWQKLNPASFIAAFYGNTYIAFFTKLDGERGALMLDYSNGTQARVRLLDNFGSALQVIHEDGGLYFAQYNQTLNTCDLYQAFALKHMPYFADWKSKEFTFRTPVNMGAIIVEGDENSNLAETEDRVFWGGPIGEQGVGLIPFGGEECNLPNLGNGASAMVKVFADGILRATCFVVLNKIMRLPKGYAARRWHFEVATITKIRRVALATSVEELRA